jgi:rare lipoprotein A
LFTSCEEPQDEFVLLPKVKTIRTIYQKGVATWYGPGFSDRKTSSGNEFDMFQFTAAHRELPLGTIIRVKNLENERCVVVLVNDRGPMNEKLILDLSKIAASNIDIIRKGSGKVDIEVLSDSENPLEKIFFVYKNLGNCHSN